MSLYDFTNTFQNRYGMICNTKEESVGCFTLIIVTRLEKKLDIL